MIAQGWLKGVNNREVSLTRKTIYGVIKMPGQDKCMPKYKNYKVEKNI